MSWREQAKFGILSAEHFFLGDGNGGLGTDITDALKVVPSVIGNQFIFYDPFTTNPSPVFGNSGYPSAPILAPFSIPINPQGGSGYSIWSIYDNVALVQPLSDPVIIGDTRAQARALNSGYISASALSSGSNGGGAGLIDGGTLYTGPRTSVYSGTKFFGSGREVGVRMASSLGTGAGATRFFGVASEVAIEGSLSTPFSMYDLPIQAGFFAPVEFLSSLIVYRDPFQSLFTVFGLNGPSGGPYIWEDQGSVLISSGAAVFLIFEVTSRPLYKGFRWKLEIVKNNSLTSGTHILSGTYIPQSEPDSLFVTPFFYSDGSNADPIITPIEMATMVSSRPSSILSDDDFPFGYAYPRNWKAKFTSEL
jgi:hypothetical protein